MNNFSRFWDKGVVLSCLACGPGVMESLIKKVVGVWALDWLVFIRKVLMCKLFTIPERCSLSRVSKTLRYQNIRIHKIKNMVNTLQLKDFLLF